MIVIYQFLPETLNKKKKKRNTITWGYIEGNWSFLRASVYTYFLLRIGRVARLVQRDNSDVNKPLAVTTTPSSAQDMLIVCVCVCVTRTVNTTHGNIYCAFFLIKKIITREHFIFPKHDISL